MRKRKLWNKTLSIMLANTMIATSGVVSKTSMTYAGESKEYIVMAENRQELNSFMEQYGDKIVEEKSTDLLEKGNMTVIDMTEAEVASIVSTFDDDGLIIEENMTVTAMAEESNEVRETLEEESDPQQTTWNIKAVNASPEELNTVTGSAIAKTMDNSSNIKIAIIDSGIDALGEVEPVERINLTPAFGEGEEKEVVSPIFEDVTGHGTSVAGIISAADDEYGLVGINPNAQLYDIKVFDEANNAPLSRILEGIQCAMEHDVNILNMSFGTPVSSEIFHQKIANAYHQGMLLIAASGNNGVVEYPAAYDEVMAVGATTEKNKVADFSITGTKSEIVAPGAAVLTSGLFGGYGVANGTSISAPHVSAAASLLWAKDTTKSNDFIRQLLNQSARKLEDENSGNGLLDVTKAFEIYDQFAEVYEPGKVEYKEIPENEDALETFDENYVVGSWTSKGHEDALANETMTTEGMTVVKLGGIAADQPDYKLTGMKKYPQLHGYFYELGDDGESRIYSNYMASYIYLTQMALGFPNTKTNSNTYTKPTKPSFMTDYDYNKINGIATATKFGGVSWSKIFADKGIAETDKNKRLFMYGVALHTVTDLFAHSTTIKGADGTWKYITHATNADGDAIPDADDNDYYPNRFTCTKRMTSEVVKRIKRNTKGSLEDFINALVDYKGAFKIPSYANKAEAVDSIYYNANKAAFDQIVN